MKKFGQIIKQAFLSLVTDDSHAYPRGQATYNDKTTEFVRYVPYGLFSNPPENSHVLLLGSQGQESTKFGLISDYINRKKDVKEGECGLYDTLTGNLVHLKENGDIEIDCKNNLVASVAGDATMEVTGDITETVGGNAQSTITGNLTANVGGNTKLNSTGSVTVTSSSVSIISSAVSLGLAGILTLITLPFLAFFNAHIHNDPVSGQTSAPLTPATPAAHATTNTLAS
jgi:phage gp45-like